MVLLAQVVTSSSFAEFVVPLGITAILGVNVWQLKATLAFRDEARFLRQWAFGEQGDNGANGDIKELRKRTHDLSNGVNAVKGKQDLYELRLATVERRVGPPDRRSE